MANCWLVLDGKPTGLPFEDVEQAKQFAEQRLRDRPFAKAAIEIYDRSEPMRTLTRQPRHRRAGHSTRSLRDGVTPLSRLNGATDSGEMFRSRRTFAVSGAVR